MDLLNQAKQFIARKASKLAMVAVPLAVLAMAVPAKAASIGAVLDPNGTDTCTEFGSAGSCTVVVAGATGGDSALNWLQMFGQATASNGSGSGSFNLSISTQSGGVSSNGGILPMGLIPVSWNFTTSGSSAINWDVNEGLSVGGTFYSFFASGSTTPGVMVTGNGVIMVSSGGAVTASSGGSVYNIELDFTSDSAFSVTIPEGSTADLNNVTAPEPASVLMMMAGGGALLLLRRRKRV